MDMKAATGAATVHELLRPRVGCAVHPFGRTASGASGSGCGRWQGPAAAAAPPQPALLAQLQPTYAQWLEGKGGAQRKRSGSGSGGAGGGKRARDARGSKGAAATATATATTKVKAKAKTKATAMAHYHNHDYDQDHDHDHDHDHHHDHHHHCCCQLHHRQQGVPQPALLAAGTWQ